MADLLDQTKELRQKLYMLEALLQIEKGRRTTEWFEGKAPEDHERPEAVKRLLETGLIEAEPSPGHFRLAPGGRIFLSNVRARIGDEGKIDWTRVNQIDFRRM